MAILPRDARRWPARARRARRCRARTAPTRGARPARRRRRRRRARRAPRTRRPASRSRPPRGRRRRSPRPRSGRARARAFGPTRSIFMTTVIDQARPWFTPSSALAATTQPQFGATAISSGTGSASAQPRMSSRRRPSRSASAPAPRLVNAFARPKATMNESTAALDPSPKSCSPISGRVERSRPTIAPTNALIATSSENCARFSRSPSRTTPTLTRSATECPARFAARISACCGGVGGMSFTSASAKASSESNWSALLWRRSNPIVEAGLADRPRPQTEPE